MQGKKGFFLFHVLSTSESLRNYYENMTSLWNYNWSNIHSVLIVSSFKLILWLVAISLHATYPCNLRKQNLFKMIRSRQLQGPMLTILSPSLPASKKAISLLSLLGKMEEVCLATEDFSSSDKALNSTFKSSIPGLSRSWDSIATRCPISDSVLHFCSSSNHVTTTDNDHRNPSQPFALLAITDNHVSPGMGKKDDTSVKDAIRSFRDLLASRINDGTTLNSTLLNLKCLIFGRVVN